MKLSSILEQGPVVGALVGAAGRGLGLALRGNTQSSNPLAGLSIPTPMIHAVVEGRGSALVRDYLRAVGGDASSWPGQVPTHMFPQWTFPIAAKTLADLKIPLWAILNGGCRLQRRGRIAVGDPIEVSASLSSVDESPRRFVLTQQIACTTKRHGAGLDATLYAIVPKSRSGASKSGNSSTDRPAAERKKALEVVPRDAQLVARWRLSSNAGLDFASVTGDFNPVHWIPAYARAMGFRAPILHGFASLARTWESLARVLLAGDSAAIEELDVRFVRPLVLPVNLGLYRRDHQIWLALERGSQPYVTGTFRASTMPRA